MDDELPPGITADDVRAFKRTIARCWVVAGLLIELPLDPLDRQSARAETAGPVLYPGIWRANAKAIMEDREMIRALAAAQRDLLTTSPSLAELAPILTNQADGHLPRLHAAFRELFTRRELAAIPPAVVLTALVRFIADRAPDVTTPRKQDERR
jgi:hypothetical protein